MFQAFLLNIRGKSDEYFVKEVLTDSEYAVIVKHYTKDPVLGLLYYALCGSDPDAFVFGDEKIDDDEVIKRLLKCIGKRVDKAEAISCQRIAKDMNSSGSQRIAACASCCETIFDCGDRKTTIVDAGPVDKLPDVFKMSKEAVYVLLQKPADLVQRHVMALEWPESENSADSDRCFYYLNPDLVPEPGVNVVLCKRCHSDPKSTFSICAGHDYGRYGNLPRNLTPTTLNAIVPVRIFHTDIEIRSNHASGHSIAFPSDGSRSVADALPQIGQERRPHVTFLGKKDEWRKSAKRYRGVYSIDAYAASSYLQVWTGLKNPFFNDIQVDYTKLRTEDIEAERSIVEDAATVNADDDTKEMADQVCNQFIERYMMSLFDYFCVRWTKLKMKLILICHV